VEEFTNDSDSDSQLAKAVIKNEFDTQILARDTADFIRLQYHMAVGGADSTNAYNGLDPEARSQWYGVSRPPSTIMDGIQGNYFGTNFDGSVSAITAQELDRRALEDPLFRITVSLPEGQQKFDPLTGTIDFEYIGQSEFTSPVLLHAALVEGTVGDNTNVLRKLIWGPAGKLVTDTWSVGEVSSQAVNFMMNAHIWKPNDLYVIAFVQDKNTKRILQTVIVKAPLKDDVVVGLPEDPSVAAIHGLEVYPNPASTTMNLRLENVLPTDYQWKVVDQRGVVVLEGKLNRDLRTPQQVDISRIANGIYFLQIQTGSRSLMYKKIAVMNE
jgi:hypothetical protein